MPVTATYYARGDSSSANNSAINTENLNATAVTELRFEAASGGDILLDYHGGAPDPDTILFVDGVQTTFTVEFTGTLPQSNKFANVNGLDLRGAELIVITDDATGQRYWFVTDQVLSPETVAAFPNGATNVNNVNNAPPPTPICFARGTRLETPTGPRAVETLRPGDLLSTADGRSVSLRWHGHRTFEGRGATTPIRIPAHALGNTRDLYVSPQHRMVVRGYRAQLHFGTDEVLAPAKGLLGLAGIAPAPVDLVTYHHLLFDRHEILLAEGAPSESYHPGRHSLDGLDKEQRDLLFTLFPALHDNPECYGPTARQALRVSEARILAA